MLKKGGGAAGKTVGEIFTKYNGKQVEFLPEGDDKKEPDIKFTTYLKDNCYFIFFFVSLQKIVNRMKKCLKFDNHIQFSAFNFPLRVVLILFFVFANETRAAIRYVRPTSYGSADGSSWQDASADLQLQINQSNAGDTIFVAEGTYFPIRPTTTNNLTRIDPNNRNNSYVLKADVKIFGGFPNTGTATWENRDWGAYPTILSGDIGVPNDSTDNCYHVVISEGNVGAATIDGFTITKGHSNNEATYIKDIKYEGYGGGGMYNVNSSPTIVNVVISRNSAIGGDYCHGGGMYNYYSSPILDNVVISGNSVLGVGSNCSSHGGGMFNYYSSPTLTHVVISGNSARSLLDGSYGGGIFNYCSSSTLVNVVISGNSAIGDANSGMGGGMHSYGSPLILTNVVISGNSAIGNRTSLGGGMYNANSSPILTNVVISENSAKAQATGDGGGMYNYNSSPILTNVVISGNSAVNEGGGIFHEFSSLVLTNVTISNNSCAKKGGGLYAIRTQEITIRNSIIWGNKDTNVETTLPITYQNCLVGGQPIRNGIILNSDPLFADTASGNYRLSHCSPARDVGNNDFYSPDSLPNLSTINVDLDGNSRIYKEIVDLGAYEYQQFRYLDTLPPDTALVLCYGDVARIPFHLTGIPPWLFIYTQDDGITYDTVQSIRDSLFLWEISPLQTTTYIFVAVGDSNCILPVMDTIEIKVLVPTITNRFFNDTLCNGSQTQAVVFSGVASDFVWSVSGDSIEGLPAGVQRGNFGEYLVENKENVALTSLITVAPHYTENGKTCVGRDTTFSITVFPEPTLTTPLENDTLCDEELTKTVEFSGAANLYEWYITDAISGFPTGVQSGNFGNYIVENKTDTLLTSFINITPKYIMNEKTCVGAATHFSITVYPEPRLTTVLQDEVLCDGQQTSAVAFSGKNTNLYQWTAMGSVSGLPSDVQTGDFGTYTVNNQTANNTQSVITVIPIYTTERKTCEGKSESFEIVVYPATQIRSFLPEGDVFICGPEVVRMEVEALGKDLEYQWYHNGFPLQDAQNNYYVLPSVSQSNSGTYYVMVSGTCGNARSRSIAVGGNIKIWVWEWNDEIIIDNSSRQYYAFQWHRDGLPISGATGGSYKEKGGLHGCYSVEITLNDRKSKVQSCERCFDKTKKYIHIYPSLTQRGNRINVRFLPPSSYINFLIVELYNAAGQRMWQQQIDNAEFEIETIHLAPGVYVLKITTGDYWRYKEKLIVY